MNEPKGDSHLRPRSTERARFFRKYYEPVALNSRHGLAVVDVGTCQILYMNARFKASHGLAPAAELPMPCCAVYGGSGSGCEARGGGCPAAEAIHGERQVRRVETRPGGDGLPQRNSEILAIPLAPRSEFGKDSEVLVVEKEEDPALLPRSQIEEEREYLASIARFSADAIIGLDLDGCVRSWNNGAVETFGYSADETLGRNVEFLVPRDERSRREYQNLLRDFERRGILKNQQAKRVHRDGRTVVVTFTMSLLRTPTGDPRGISLICRDVTMEVLLKELIDHQMRAMSVTHEIGDLLHSTRSVDEILQLILLGVTAGQGLGFNRAFLLLVEGGEAGAPARLRGRLAIGPSNAEEANRIWTSLSSEPLKLSDLYSRYRQNTELHDVLVNSIVGKLEAPLDREDHVLVRAIHTREALNVIGGKVFGEDREVDRDLRQLLSCDSFAVVPLNTREKALGVLVVDNKITGIGISDADVQMLKVFANHAGIALENSQLRAHLERRLQELEQLNHLLQENQTRLMRAERLSVIGEMAARVVHEVRNPLVSIGGFARLARRGLGDEDPRSDYLRIVSDEVTRLERIVSELLDFSRPQNRLQLRDVPINDLVHEIVRMATIEAESHGLVIQESYDASLGRMCIDADKTRQVLLNVIRNAIEVMEDTGTLSVETAGVDGNRFRIGVRDSGPGIPADKKDRVFDPGYTTRQDGTGFGLAIAKRLVELQGGSIAIRDAEPHGVVFDVTLPRRVELPQ